MALRLFEAFERREYIHMDDLPILANYICGNINSEYLLNRGYYYELLNYVSKLKIVCMWKQRRSLPTVSCKGEAICNDKLINFYKDQEHKNCGCSTV